MKDCIVLQTHIDTHDAQGNLDVNQRKFIVDLSIRQLRHYNKNAYIIVSGHGVVKPSKEVINMCDYFTWEDIASQMDNGQVKGMPAQYYYVSKGIKHAKENGFTHVLKTRGDTMIGVINILDLCKNIINKEKTKLLVTQQTGWENFKMGDCFMYGEIDLMDKIWDMYNKVLNLDGLANTGMHFVEYFNKDITINNFVDLLKKNCSFRNIITLKFACLRWNYSQLESMGWSDIMNQIYDFTFDFNSIHWGRINNWHQFDSEGNMIISSQPFYYSEKTYYN